MKVKQFKYFQDNLGYLVYDDSEAIAVDGGAAHEILQFMEDNSLKLKTVTNTHSHNDHTNGNWVLLENTEARYIPAVDLASISCLSLNGSQLRIFTTPGHTRDSVCLLGDGFLLSGDTLFNGKVGKCFTEDIKGFYKSIEKLAGLPDDTLVLAGHDYVEEYMEFCRMVEPSNGNIDDYMKKYDPGFVSATLAEEKSVDPFLRLDEPGVIEFLARKKLPRSTRLRRFGSLLSLM